VFNTVLDTTPPDQLSFTVTDNVGADQGVVSAGATIDDNRPVISGNAGVDEAGGEVSIYLDGAYIGYANIGSDGSWQFAPTIPFAEGVRTITIRITDVVGNQSMAFPPFAVTIDAAPPPAPVITRGDDNFAPKRPWLDDGNITDDTTPILIGTGVPGTLVRIFATGPDGVARESGFTTVDRYGDWRVELTSPLGAGDGAYSFQAVAEDVKGQRSPLSNVFNLMLDTTAPAKPDLPIIAGKGGVVVSSGSAIDEKFPTISGNAGTDEAGGHVTIYADGKQIGTTAIKDDGSWLYTPPYYSAFDDGDYTITIKITDKAGNESALNDGFKLTVDTVAPGARAFITAISDDTGVPDDFITDDDTLIIKGILVNDRLQLVTSRILTSDLPAACHHHLHPQQRAQSFTSK